jgi:hypothetical protein
MGDGCKLTQGNYYGVGRFPVGPGGAHKCPVCEKTVFEKYDSYEICEVCRWEDSGLAKSDPDLLGGPNQMSLNEARAYLEEIQKAHTISGTASPHTGPF